MIHRLSLLLLVFVSLASPARAETISLVADIWCPYNCDPSTGRPGFMVEITKKAFEKHGISIEYTIMPWTKAVKETREGKYTALVGASRNDAPDFVFPDIPQGEMKNSFFVKKDSDWQFTGIPSLENISIGVVGGYTYGESLDDYIQKNGDSIARIQVISGDNALQLNLKKLLLGRIGALVEDRNVMSHLLTEEKKADLVKIAGDVPSDAQNPLFIPFSPANPNAKRYARILSEETKAMRESGELEKIMSSYGITSPTPVQGP